MININLPIYDLSNGRKATVVLVDIVNHRYKRPHIKTSLVLRIGKKTTLKDNTFIVVYQYKKFVLKIYKRKLTIKKAHLYRYSNDKIGKCHIQNF